MSVLEAMAMGTPLIVTRSRGITPFLRNESNALTVPPESVDSIREALTQLSDQEVLEQLAEGGMEYVKSVHSMETFVDDFLTLVSEDER